MELGEITRVVDCGIALAIPLHRGAFLRDLESDRREYARFYRDASGGRALKSEAVGDKYERQEGAPLRAMLTEARSLGAEVVTDCTLGALATLLQRKRVIIVAAHWRDGRLRRQDIRSLPDLCRRLHTESEGAFAAVAARLAERCRRTIDRIAAESDDTEMLAGELLDAINTAMAAGLLLPHPQPIPEAPWPPIYYIDHNRAALREAAPDLIEDTVGLELSDGTWSAAQLCEAAGPGFDGLLDLSVCHSVLLAEEIKRASPACLIMANREITAPAVRLLMVREVLRRLARSPDSYLQVSLAMRTALREGQRA